MNGRSKKRTLPLIESLHPKDVATEKFHRNLISKGNILLHTTTPMTDLYM